ncbi:hypothetical protein AcW1_008112 [Taiwanofungus camphoratus]|nr:hypothetical protein AcW1_008112 [Antrodia cinnamomea]
MEQNQVVSVRLQSNIWVVGIIVGILDLARRFTDVKYEVQYMVEGQLRTSRFGPEAVRASNRFPDPRVRADCI